jgi:hypothetical protein
VLDAFNREARPEPHHQREAIAAALKALYFLAYEICDGPSFRLVVDFDDIRAIAKELENQ